MMAPFGIHHARMLARALLTQSSVDLAIVFVTGYLAQQSEGSLFLRAS